MNPSDLINSPFVNTLLKWGMSRSGILVTSAVAYVIAQLGLPALLGPDATDEVRKGLEAGGYALVAIIYAWLAHRMKNGVRVMQAQMNESDTRTTELKLDGIPGNSTIAQSVKVTDVSVAQATRAIADR